MESRETRFSQRHPFAFGLLMISMAVALILGAMAFFGFNGMSADFGGDKIGQVNLYGTIMESREVVDWINELADDDSVKGVLMRVDSPGGTIGPSQEIYAAVAALAKKKPVVASYGTVAASGGYYSSAPCTKIVANPGSITGSIGVIAEFMTFESVLDKLGIRPEVLTTGPFKGAGSPLKTMTPPQREQMLGLLNDLHAQFVDDVARARKLDRDSVAALADGSAMTGKQAMMFGLVDELGSRDDAIRILKELCNISGKVPLVEGPLEEKTFMQEMLGVNMHEVLQALGRGWTFSYR